ncbi:hypothetical protein PL11201_80489 [Planktothrix sp. PCC 11201]|nr:hypothetical protein PL11201_80489 [Planktothrix sp. PCC 11201]
MEQNIVYCQVLGFYVNPELGLFWVIDYRIYQPEHDDKTKLDHVLLIRYI